MFALLNQAIYLEKEGLGFSTSWQEPLAVNSRLLVAAEDSCELVKMLAKGRAISGIQRVPLELRPSSDSISRLAFCSREFAILQVRIAAPVSFDWSQTVLDRDLTVEACRTSVSGAEDLEILLVLLR